MRLSFPSSDTVQLLLAPVLLTLLSIVTLYAIDVTYMQRQLISLVLAIAAGIVLSRFDATIIGHLTKFIYIGMIAALVILLLIGPEVRGSVRWFDIFGLRIQVSEVIKPFFITSLAHLLSHQRSKSLTNYITTLIFVAPIVLLTLMQPDLGSAIIFAGIAGFMMLMHAFPLKYYAVTGIAAILPMPLVYTYVLQDYQRNRITSFLDATSDPFGTSYNSIQALISVGSGGFFGKGFGEATQSILNFLPEHHTDFIFASISESLGFLGASIVILLFVYFLYTLLKIGQTAENSYNTLVMYGIFALFLIHVTFNIGMNLALLPVVGITLPFLSYGGSALITNCMLLGISYTIMHSKEKYTSLEIT